MPLSSRRDHKQASNTARPNRRRSSATLRQNSPDHFAKNLYSWYARLPGLAKLLLPTGMAILILGLVWPNADKTGAESISLQTSMALATPPVQTKQPPEIIGNNPADSSRIDDSESIQKAATAPLTEAKHLMQLELELPPRHYSENSGDIVNSGSNFDPDISQVTLSIKNGDTLGELFTKNRLSYADMLSILKDKTAKKYLTRIKPDELLLVQRKETSSDDDGVNYQVQNLTYQINIEEELKVTRQSDESFETKLVKTPLDRRIAHAHGTITDSLFLAGQSAGLNDNTIMNMAGIFQWDVDFIQDIRKGDNFTVIYEQLFKNGEHVGNGEILAAEFHNDGDTFHAIRFVDENGDSNYYAPSGKSMKKAFLRAPIAISPRVTSSFNPRRFHPVHKRVRPHRGVDYGGPLNTPILAAGDGKIIFRGRKGGYGNTVIIQHGGNITTLYAHLNKFNSKARNGSRVKQGQTIGYLGATGTVTAKHLHYEYRLNGVHRNPRTVKLPNAKALPKKYKAEFDKIKSDYMAQLNTIKRAYTLNAAIDKRDTHSTTSSASTSGH